MILKTCFSTSLRWCQIPRHLQTYVVLYILTRLTFIFNSTALAFPLQQLPSLITQSAPTARSTQWAKERKRLYCGL